MQSCNQSAKVLIEIEKIDFESNNYQIYTAVFTLFNIHWKHSPILSFKKLQYHYETQHTNSDLADYLACVHQAHYVLLNQFIFKGYKFKKLMENPLGSCESDYGQPVIYQQLLDQIISERDEIVNHHFQMGLLEGKKV